jgi:ketol-acid reductoisomerase
MSKLYGDADADLSLLRGKTIVTIGFGTQGMAQSLNIRDSGLEVIVGAEDGTEDQRKAQQSGFVTVSLVEAAERGDIFILQVPDMAFRLADIYNREIRGKHKSGDLICLSSAYNYYYGHVVPPEGVDAIVAAPKSPGSAVRDEYMQGRGVPGLLAIHQDASGKAHEIGLALCKALGFTRSGVQDATVEEEVVTDLLGEHCAWGAIVVLLRTVFEVLVEEGYDPNLAYFEAINESKLTTDLIYRYGLAGMLKRISNTAAYGAMAIGPKIIDDHVKENVRLAVRNIKSVGFDADWNDDYKQNYWRFNALLEEIGSSQADVVGDEIRKRLGVASPRDLQTTNA